MDEGDREGRRSLRIKNKRTFSFSNKADEAIDVDVDAIGEENIQIVTTPITGQTSKKRKKKVDSSPSGKGEVSVIDGEKVKSSKRHKPIVVTNSSGVKLILSSPVGFKDSKAQLNDTTDMSPTNMKSRKGQNSSRESPAPKAKLSRASSSKKGSKVKGKSVGDSSIKKRLAKKAVVKSIKKKQTDKVPTLRVCTTPKPLYQAIQSGQKRMVEKMGFGGMLSMRTDHIPSKMAFYLLDRLHTYTMELRLVQGTIQLSTQMVHDILGTPIGGHDIYLTDPSPRAKCVKTTWRKQFPGKKIRISAVMEKVEKSKEADLQFKINFLMLFICTMAECNSSGHCNASILNYISDDTDISKIDWSKYVFDCLRTSKDNWKRDSCNKTFYSGPITFLTVLYADITECMKFKVERRRPAISVWNIENLRRREFLELSDGGFGTWPLLAHGGITEIRTPDAFAERNVHAKFSLLIVHSL